MDDTTSGQGFLAIKLRKDEDCILTGADGRRIAIFTLNAKEARGARIIVRAGKDVRVSRERSDLRDGPR
jgi:hypothetical protein